MIEYYKVYVTANDDQLQRPGVAHEYTYEANDLEVVEAYVLAGKVQAGRREYEARIVKITEEDVT